MIAILQDNKNKITCICFSIFGARMNPNESYLNSVAIIMQYNCYININKIFSDYNIKLEHTEFNLTSKFNTSELGRLQSEVGKYNNFIIKN